MIYKKQFVKYKDTLGKNPYKSKTIQVQSIPMRTIVERFASGQLFGISQIPLDFDEIEDESNYQKYFPDPCDPLAPERAIMESKEVKHKIDKHVEYIKKQKESSQVEDGN